MLLNSECKESAFTINILNNFKQGTIKEHTFFEAII